MQNDASDKSALRNEVDCIVKMEPEETDGPSDAGTLCIESVLSIKTDPDLQNQGLDVEAQNANVFVPETLNGAEVLRELLMSDTSAPSAPGYTCYECGLVINSKADLRAHVSVHMEEKPFACSLCDYRASQKADLVQHRRTHGEKPFACKNCDYRAANKTALSLHMKTHTGPKLYSCELCDHRTKQKAYLVFHMRVHTGEKPYACDKCDYRATQKCSLMRHQSVHTGIKPWKCKYCEYRCSQKNAMNSHLRTHTGEKPYACHLCEYRATVKGALMKHMRNHTSV